MLIRKVPKFSPIGLIFSLLFLGVFFALSYYVYFLAPVEANLSGVFVVLPGFPWSLIAPYICKMNGDTPAAVRYIVMGVVPAFINAFILYKIGKAVRS